MSNVAILFPGQGAQAVGMGRDLAEGLPECKALMTRANEVLGYDLATLCFEGPIETLTQSVHAQPAIFTVSLMAVTALTVRQPAARFAATAGLSSGEWAALCLAGVVSFEDSLRILKARGQFMQEACLEQPGGMVSVIGAEREKLEDLCRRTGVEIANLNSPDQTVLSGRQEGIAEAEKLASEYGARKAIRLNVAGAFHSSLMASAARRLEEVLAPVLLKKPNVPVWSNVTGQPHGGPEDIRRAMVQQVTGSVKWVDGVRGMRAAGVGAVVECGPGKVLTGLVKRIDKDIALNNIQDLSGLEQVVQAGLFG